MSFSPGEYIEAVEDHVYEDAAIHRGVMYCVEECEPIRNPAFACDSHAECPMIGVRLKSPRLPFGDWWCSESFRSVYKPDESMFNSIIESVRGLVDA